MKYLVFSVISIVIIAALKGGGKKERGIQQG